MFHCEDEPEEFEWNRLTELQRRNTLCLPHLKTSYPVETQRVKPQEMSDEALRQSIMPNGSGKKRKKEQLSDEDDQKASMNLRSSKQVIIIIFSVFSWILLFFEKSVCLYQLNIYYGTLQTTIFFHISSGNIVNIFYIFD